MTGQSNPKNIELMIMRNVQHNKQLKKTNFHVAREDKVV